MPQFVHGFLAVLFGLILPFVCWGAEATPGHPHLRAHFVFAAPSHTAVGALPAANTAQELIRMTGQAIAAGAYSACTTPLRAADAVASSAPAGQSIPSVLAVTLLLLAAIAMTFCYGRREETGWSVRAAALFYRSPALTVATPPPRLQPIL